MRALFIFLACIVGTATQGAEPDTVKVLSKITNVTVYFNGAQVKRSADVKLKKGKHLLVLQKLPQQMSSQSIQVNAIPACKTLSVKYQQEKRQDSKKSKEVEAIDKIIQGYEDKILELKSKSSVYDLEEQVIMDNSRIGSSTTKTTVAELEATANFYRERLSGIRIAKLNINSEIKALNDKVTEAYQNMNKFLTENEKSFSEILVMVECERDITTDLVFSYYIESAGWTPLYDFRVDDITKPLTISYNANVYQSSGEDWKDIKIKLSTNDPLQSGQVPELTAWYVDRRPGPINMNTASSFGTLMGKITDNVTSEAIPFVNLILEKDGYPVGGTTTDFDGNYKIKPIQPGTYTLKASYVGYDPAIINYIVIKSDQITFQNLELNGSGVELEEVEVTNYNVPRVTSEEIAKMPSRSANAIATTVGGVSNDRDRGSIRGQRPENTVMYIDGIRVRGTSSLPESSINSPFSYNTYSSGNNSKVKESKPQKEIVTTNYLANDAVTNITNIEYDIELPYTILSDGEDYLLKIKDASVDVDYVYHLIPKLDKDAFLTAEITNWSELDLLSGKSSIYFQGSYVGESEINASKTNDTLSISLGRDNNIKVAREGDKTVYDRRVVSGNVKHVIGWNITIKNNRASNIHMIVEDQYPLADKKSVVVELLEAKDAKVNDKTGNLKWTIDIPAREKKELKFSYMVKYPVYEDVYLE